MTVSSWFRSSPSGKDSPATKDILKYLYPGSHQYTRQTESTHRSRFSQLLLEHGEKALQDWAVVAYSNPLEHSSIASTTKANEGQSASQIQWEQAQTKKGPRQDHFSKKKNAPNLKNKDIYPSAHMTKLEGRLHLCTGSLVFEPNELSRGIVRCPFSRMETPPNEHPVESGFEAMCVEFHSRRHFVMKANNNIGAFQNVASPCRFQFTFLHSSPSSFVELCRELFTMAGKNSRPSHARPELDAVLKPMLDRPFDRNNFVDVREQALTPNLRCSILSPLENQPGALVLSSERIYFQQALGVLAGTETRADSWLQRNAVATARRYNGLRDSALEIYWKDETSTLIAFERRHDRELVLRTLNPVVCVTDRDFVVEVVKCWQSGELSNFEYLLALNSAAGRSFHDLSRYPVFPWVISDYTSSKLDLNNPSTFRDLSKPIGALNKTRLEYFQTRLKSMQDTSMEEAFLYGTHYSAPGYILYFLVRSMPEHMLCLQNGKFDSPDRMFHSIAQCYSCALTNHADVKELTPEFYNPSLDFDFLINVKGLQLGATQNGERVDDVKLPPWARSPRDYIKKNQKALESEYCTKFLPRWIDLIFGCKSRGDEAVEANNVFHHNAYLGPTDIASMQTEDERFQAELQATEFGIVPDKLFCLEHPSKNENFDESFISNDVGRASSKDDSTVREAWELLDAPANNRGPLTQKNTFSDPIAPEPAWDQSIKTLIDSRTPNQPGVALRGTGDGSDHHGSFASPDNARGRDATPLRLTPATAEEADIPVVTSALEDSVEWDMKVLERKQVHSDAVSGCALFWEQGETGLSILVTSSLDGGLTVHRVSFEETQEPVEQQQKIGFTSTLSRFSYGNIINRNLTQTPVQSRLSEYRSHTSRDPLASLAITCDGAGGSIAFAGGHDDVVLAYGIKSACAVASLYSHRDAVTGLDLVERTPFDKDCAIWLENSNHIIVSGSWDATVKVWSASVAAGETVAINREPIAELFDADASIVSVAVKSLPSGGIVIAAGCQDGSFCVWNIHNDGVQVQIHNEPAKKGSGPCSVVKWASEGGTIHLFTAFSTGKLGSYVLVDGELKRESAVSVGVAVSAMMFMHGASSLLLGCADGGLRLVPLRDSTYFDNKPTLWKAVNSKASPGISTISVIDVITSEGKKTVCCTGAEDGSVALFELKRVLL